MAKSDTEGSGNGAESLEELRKRYDELQQRKIRAEADREGAQKRLDELKEEARATYGTDDIEELKKKLSEMKAENERKRAEYQAHLEKIERDLAEVESRFDSDDLEGEDQG
jgi:DNA repair exonuclease SbcCD ATPase subunit